MRLASFSVSGRSTWGTVTGDRLTDCGGALGGRCPRLIDALRDDVVTHAIAEGGPTLGLDDVRFLPVVPEPGKIVCVGLNYDEHRAEADCTAVDNPTIFLRTPTSQVGHGEPIVRPPEAGFLDYEGEIAIVIGKPGRRIDVADAWAHIAGYAPYNDGSVRDWQNHSTQWTPGKNFDATGGFGPWMAMRDEIGDGQDLSLETRVNGVSVQCSTSSRMIFGFPRLIAYISRFATLLPGDVIVTGTPAGVGKFREPPLPLKDGDVVEVIVGNVGHLVNPVRDEQP